MLIHDQIHARRLELGLTQADMKARAGMSQQQYQRIEANGNPNLDTLQQVMKGLEAELMLIPNDRIDTVLAVLQGAQLELPPLEDPWKDLLGDLYEDME